MSLTTTCPDSLFNACLKLVTENLDLVDSFHGFPSLVGEKIFRKALQTQQIKTLSYAGQALQLFAEAFGPELLSSLNVSGHHLGLNYYLDQLLCFTDLVSLDVSRCGLGDHHEILAHISNLTSLETLYLCNNHLSDEGIRKLTLAYRMFGRGPHGLKTLDLSGNTDLTKGCLKYMSPFPLLHLIFLFDCDHIKVGSYKDWSVQKDGDGVAVCRCAVVTTSGWASSLVNTWMDEARDRARKQPSKKKSFFYSKPVIEPQAKSCSQDPQDVVKTILVAYRYQNSFSKDSSETKKSSLGHSVEEENSLMNLYSSNNETDCFTRQKASLLTGLDNSVKINSQCNTPTTTVTRWPSAKLCLTPTGVRHSFALSHQTSLNEKNSKQSWNRASSAESSKCSMNALSKLQSKTQCQHKENTETWSKTCQPKLLECCTLRGQRQNDKSKDSSLLPKLFKRQALSTGSTGSVKSSSSESLVGASSCLLKKRSISDENGQPVAKTTTEIGGPKSKRRKIVIVKPEGDTCKLKTNSCAKTKDMEIQNELVEKSKHRTSFLDSLHKWI